MRGEHAGPGWTETSVSDMSFGAIPGSPHEYHRVLSRVRPRVSRAGNVRGPRGGMPGMLEIPAMPRGGGADPHGARSVVDGTAAAGQVGRLVRFRAAGPTRG